VTGSLVRVLLQIFSRFRQFENWSIFVEIKAYEVKAYKKVCQFFWATLYVLPGVFHAVLE